METECTTWLNLDVFWLQSYQTDPYNRNFVGVCTVLLQQTRVPCNRCKTLIADLLVVLFLFRWTLRLYDDQSTNSRNIFYQQSFV